MPPEETPQKTKDQGQRPKDRSRSELRLAMLGMIEGNAHPYSWSAIINGYDPAAMDEAIGHRYPVIPEYLGRRHRESVGIPGARVTHVWTDDPAEAPRIAAAARIPRVLANPREALGEVDAVVIATDDGNDHVERARPFAEAGLPLFIDKPLATNLPDLRRFMAWEREGKPILSSSGLRYAPELAALRAELPRLGKPRWFTGTTVKTWERYGIHAVEPVLTLLGPGVTHVANNASGNVNIVTIRHASGSHATIAVLPDAPGSSGTIHAYGTEDHRSVKLADTYTAFRNQMLAFINMVRTGEAPHPFADTIELMLVLIAGRHSRDREGRPVALADLRERL